jgi:DNA-binding transcriptional LysR family regulator
MSGILESWGQRVNVRVDGSSIFNATQPQVDAALAGLSIALLPEDELMSHIESNGLIRVLEDWCPKFAGYQ